jgi:hypothetical protein
MKHGATLVFDGGNLQIKLRGFDAQDGWGTLTFDDDQIERVPLDGSYGCVGKIEIPPSELRELRDFLNKYLPAVPSPDRTGA